MGLNLAQKILKAHLVEGEMVAGKQVGIRIDQTLTQDATGTMAYLQFEAMGVPRIKAKLSVSYIDHNMLQDDFKNADDHLYLQTVAAKYGLHFSRPGNGICHQVHLERFGAPGQTLLGSDSHTPTQGGIGMIAIGAGGLDIALAMAGQPFYLSWPEVVNVHLTGKLKSWVAAKDIILEVLRRLTVAGGVGKIIEYTGPGVKSLSVPERSTITNMGAELGATTSVFPSDDITKKFLTAQKRGNVFKALSADADAKYDKTVEIDLDKLEPLTAQPHSPDNVTEVKKLKGTKVTQVAVGSCTNSSFRDLMTVAGMLKGKTVAPGLSLAVTPGSKQVYEMISANGALKDIIASGARILESGCGPCIGMGFAPNSGGVSVRSFNRNFPGRSGTKDANVYLASVETCIAAALTGEITDPRKIGKSAPKITWPKTFMVQDNMIIKPSKKAVEVKRGPNIQPLPETHPLSPVLSGAVLLKTGDNITTDHIMPAGAKVLPLRSNIPEISKFVFASLDATFHDRAKAAGGGFIVGGVNYGQGSSREHAALAPMYLGVKAVIAKAFARIHRSNLVNFGIVPFTFVNEGDYEKIAQGDKLTINVGGVETDDIVIKNETSGAEIPVKHGLSGREKDQVRAGGALGLAKQAK
ncbi:MAG: aconitate hydratase [Nitrospinae bacterium]|nr:aconitate hydratase [Nitrospinota bacterium]